MTGPLHTTGISSESNNRLIDITLMPCPDSLGKIPSSFPCAFPWMPNVFGMLGPVMSASKIAVLYPLRFIRTDKYEVVSDLPTPPFPLTTPITFFTLLCLFSGSIMLFLESEEHVVEQLLHSPEQLIVLRSFSR